MPRRVPALLMASFVVFAHRWASAFVTRNGLEQYRRRPERRALDRSTAVEAGTSIAIALAGLSVLIGAGRLIGGAYEGHQRSTCQAH